ncbi:hypothetical protein MUP01_14315 [Candidatus Bathyarchaeota archaeon]|nr:hypothetical protein [Candidatus Bathyarchaeota archaeon]
MERMTEPTEEKLPISEFYKVIDFLTLFKSQKWWEAVVIFEAYGKRSIGLYLWQKREDAWKRKHKFNIRNLDEWSKLKNAIEQLAPKLGPK